MDNAIIYSLLGIVILIGIIIFTFNTSSNNKPKNIKTKSQKRAEILDTCKTQLQKALVPLKDDKEAILKKKSEMLKKISNELSRNIFFDNNEIKEIIAELAKN